MCNRDVVLVMDADFACLSLQTLPSPVRLKLTSQVCAVHAAAAAAAAGSTNDMFMHCALVVMYSHLHSMAATCV